jgi:hypothetical protein
MPPPAAKGVKQPGSNVATGVAPNRSSTVAPTIDRIGWDGDNQTSATYCSAKP